MTNTDGIAAKPSVKKWSVGHRLWHWLNALAITVLLSSAVLLDTEIGEKALNVHKLAGIAVGFLFLFRLFLVVFGKDTRIFTDVICYSRKALKIFVAKKFPRSWDDFHVFHKAGVKIGYPIVYVAIFLMVLSGLMLSIFGSLDFVASMGSLIGEVHEIGGIVVFAFVVLHILGVIYAENTDEANIVSDMIHGGVLASSKPNVGEDSSSV